MSVAGWLMGSVLVADPKPTKDSWIQFLGSKDLILGKWNIVSYRIGS